MPTITVRLETPVRRSFRVEQVAGMFDVPVEERMRHEVVAEVPGMEEEWTIGAIVGPSGSGKTTLARAAFGDSVWQASEWPRGVAVVDALGDVGARGSGFGVEGSLAEKFPLVPSPESRTPCLSIREITRVLCGVGLGSVPTWLKPYEVLSTGEKFRAELAWAVTNAECGVRNAEWQAGESTEYSVLSTEGGRRGLIVVDEFTSSLDRTVAKTTSAAVGRLMRSFAPNGRRFVAVTCHEDILPWLSPDWTLGLGGGGTVPWLTRQRPAQPSIELTLDRVPQAMWARFAPHHYLAGRMAASATCYAAMWNREPIGFCAVAAALGWKKTKRIQRLVVLPEFQGMGVGGKLLDAVAVVEASKGNRVTITASHPAVLGHCSKSEQWRLIGVKKHGSTRQRMEGREVGSSVGRAVVGFEWVGK